MSNRHWANDFDQIARMREAYEERKSYEDAPVHEVASVPSHALTAGPSSPPVALTPGQLLHRQLPDLVWRYVRCWQTIVQRQSKPLKLPVPVLSLVARGPGKTEHDAPLFTVSPIVTNKIFLVDNGPGHHLNLAGADPLIWIDKDPINVGAPYHQVTDVPAPTPCLTCFTMTEAQRNRLMDPFQRVAWRIVGPFNARGIEQDPSALVEHGEAWHPTSTFHVLKVWHGASRAPLHVGFKSLGLHEPGHREAGGSAQVLR
ncbi:proteophosphoglycan ppg4 [Rhodotorula toruloides]|uniref:Proteophosphoglycan ppg4 n=1 Tax=Rhodotorula toruloides TaxID=5286 RepID=A0A511KCS0_RHOTO|nr:proteophosphoglycan ppg4 [Rhodotorula toruloides]